jgi:hypothetical protein
MKVFIFATLVSVSVLSAARTSVTVPMSSGKSGKLTYTPESNGDRVPDFSYAGYAAGESPIPDAPIKLVVAPIAGDNTSRIQAALDYVAALPLDEHSLRGAVLLQKGKFEIDGGLSIHASGIVLRGQGPETILFAAVLDRRTLITISGTNDLHSADAQTISDSYVPVNATHFQLADAPNFKVGDRVIITRACTAKWITALKVQDIGGGMGSGWKPGSREIQWDRTVTAIDGKNITIDVPLTNSLDANFGGGTIAPYTWPGRITQVGVENLNCDSAFDPANPKDEAHSWIAITMNSVRDGWVRQVNFSHFASSAVTLFEKTSRITVEDCKSLDPASENAGYRRDTFFTNGQQTLFQRLYSEHGRHDFSVGFCAAGPNAFVQCEAREALADSGAIDSWATGILYDNVRIDGAALSLFDRRFDANFAGWSAANSVIWQCNASLINCFDPPTAHNWCFASWGEFSGDSGFFSSDNNLSPASLYYGQLAQRLGPDVMNRAQLMAVNTRSSRNPTPADAAAATAQSVSPAPQLSDWIDAAATRTPIPTDAGGAKTIESVVKERIVPLDEREHHISVTNGWLTDDGALVTGGRQSIKWWRGGIRPDEIAESAKEGPNPTRFVPGRIGQGLTDDLDELANHMLAANRKALDYHYGLWYDIRDIDHERVRRITGDVWPPFYEMPFARSGTGTAWDGLSKYDLTKYNPWYWSRLKQFADIADQRGLILFNNDLFQHNVLEAGAHWASCPWRSANNINNTGFPEPPPYAGDKLIFMAEQFYDETNPHRRDIYRAYFRKCLDNFAANTNVIQFTSAEFSGPTHFVQFWIDTIADWEKEIGKKPMIGLAAPKDAQDAILADPTRAAIVNVIDIRYWWYQAGGKLYAPPGGKNLTTRQSLRTTNPKMPNFEQALRAVKEYREKFPDKAILLAPEDGFADYPWAILMGGGSMPNFTSMDPGLSMSIPHMRPIDLPNSPKDQYILADPGKSYLIYASHDSPIPPADATSFTQHWIDPKTGQLSQTPTSVLWLTHS